MIALLAFLGGWAIRSAIIVLVAYGIAWSVRKRSAAMQNAVWRTALATVLFVAIGMGVSSQIGFSLPSIGPLRSAMALDIPLETFPTAPGAVPPTGIVLAPVNPAANDTDLRMVLGGLVGILYLLGVAVIGGHWLSSWAYIRRRSHAAQRLDDGVLVTSDPHLSVPFTFGWRRPFIVLPASAQTLDEVRRAAILRHERAHIERNDWVWQSLSSGLAAFQWFNPAIWILSAELRATAEEAADNAVIAEGASATAYAKDLLLFATHEPSFGSAALRFSRKRRLSKRIENLVDAERDRRMARPGQILALAATLAPVGMAIASYGPQPPQASAAPDVPYQRREGLPSKFSDGTTATILYVGPRESSRLPTWLADGSPAPSGTPASYGFNYAGGPGIDHRKLVVGATLKSPLGVDEPIVSNWQRLVYRLNGRDARGGSLRVDQARDRILLERSFEIPPAWKTGDLEIGRGVGPFKDLAETRDGRGDLGVVVDNVLRPGQPNPPANVTSSSGYLSYLRFVLPEEAKEMEWRLLAFDKEGKELSILGNNLATRRPDLRSLSGSKSQPSPPQTVEFTTDAPPEKLYRFVLRARPFEWIQIRDIALYPRP